MFFQLLACLVLCAASLSLQAAPEDPQTRAQIDALSRDQRYIDFTQKITATIEERTRPYLHASRAERQELIGAMRVFLENLQSTGVYPTSYPQKLRGLLALDESLAGEYLDILEHIKIRYPLINQSAGFGEANAKIMGMEYGFHDIGERDCTEIDCECYDQCEREFRNAYNQAIAGWFGGMILSIPTGPIGFIVSVGGITLKVMKLEEELAECQAKCRGPVDDYPLCKSNADCHADQYCRNPVGNPVNACAPKKALGKTCNNGSQCDSGCCKYHMWSNPVYPVCRPASKCN